MHCRTLRRLLSTVPLWCAALAHAQPPAKDPWHERARAMLQHLVNVPTVAGRDRVPELAQWLAGEYRAAGFPDADIHIVPYEHTAAFIARWRAPGKPAGRPIMLMAHLDVVEALPGDWKEADPFVFEEKGGYYYGRGTADIKQGVVATTLALFELKAQGFRPDRDIVVFYTGDEETDGHGAILGATAWRDLLDVEYGLNSDAGGGEFSADGKAIGFTFQTAQKAYATFTLTVRNPGGHSSHPVPDNAIYRLSAALLRLQSHRFEPVLNETTRAYFSERQKSEPGALGDAMRAWLANPADGAAADRIEAADSEIGYTRTTCVATQLAAGHAENALPQTAVATVNCRILPGVAPEVIRGEIARAVADPAVAVVRIDDTLSAPASPLRPDLFAAFASAVHARHPGVPILPEMAADFSDGQAFRAHGIPVYGADGSWLVVPDDLRTHGQDERLPVQALDDDVDHWMRMVRVLAGGE